MRHIYLHTTVFLLAFMLINQTVFAQCTNASSFGSATAPTGTTTVTVTTCQYAAEYQTISGVAAATSYLSTIDLAGGFITVRQGTSNGPLIASGTTPLLWASTLAGTYYIHFNTNAGCGTDASCHTTDITHVQGGCTNTSSYGSATAPTNAATATITSCQYAGEYATITSCAAAATYTSTSSVATDYITVHQGTPGGPIIAAGTTPLNWTVLAAGTHYIHYNTNSSCGIQNVCRTTDITHVPVVCTNTSPYGTATAPVNALLVITTCQFAGEYSTINGCAATTQYISSTDLIGGYYTVHQGTFNGPVVGSGVAPLVWNSTVAGVYYVHLNTTSACGTDAICHEARIEHTCVGAPSGVVASPSNVCAGLLSNLNATSVGNSIRWYTVATGGTSIGTSPSASNFGVNPIANTTYYAEAFNGSCAGPRIAVLVLVDPSPNDPMPVTATPAIICLGSPTDLLAFSDGFIIVNDFVGVYAPANWTESHTPITDVGVITTTGAPLSVSIESSNGGNTGLHSVIWTVTVLASGDITFDWNYITTDVDGSAFDYPQYAINGVIIGDIPGFVSGGANSQSGSCTIAITAGQTFSLLMTASDDVLGSATTVFSNFTGPGVAPGTIYWYTVATGGTTIGNCPSGTNFPVTPGTTTTYYAEGFANGCTSANRTAVTVTIEIPSTTPTMTPMPGTYCPNTTLTLTAAGGTAGSDSAMEWYTGANGTGTWLGSGASLNITPTTSGVTYYVRREGTCNTTTDDVATINIKDYIYGLNGATTPSYCTDNTGWHHFFSGNEILLSVQGDLTGAPAGFPVATVLDNSASYQITQGPFTAPQCVSGLTPGEERFEMGRSWNLDFGGGTLNPPYNVRFYYNPVEKAAIETAAANWMATYGACGYTYKYANPLGFYWFKNIGSNYTAPDYDGTHYAGPIGTAGGTTNYVELTAVTSFSGGSGAVILVPNSFLPVEWLYFDGVTDHKTNFLRWATESEQNSSHFNIQRSKDGVSFTTIGSAEAQGTSSVTNHYTFDDTTPFKGSNYYRLELVDADGTVSYSSIILLVIAADGLAYTFYPNPTNDVLNYQYEAQSKELLEVQVIDVYGRILLKKDMTSQIGLNQIPVNLGEYPVGSYMVRVRHLSNGNVHTTKVIRSK